VYIYLHQTRMLMSERRFSRPTLIAAIGSLEEKYKTHASLTRYLLRLGADINRRCEEGILKHRFNCLIKVCDEEPDYLVEDGGLLWNEIVENAVSALRVLGTYVSLESWEMHTVRSTPARDALVRALDRDGFVIRDNVLHSALPSSLKLPEAEDDIFRLLSKHQFAVAKGHLDQAFANHTDGQWASANSQTRSFLDALLDEIAERFEPSISHLASGQPRRTQLALRGFLSRDLNEWDDNGVGFINGLVKRLHPHGSHPGLSNQDDSTFRLHAVLLTARLLLLRYDTWPQLSSGP
jgi:hypothetical protein